MSQAFMMYAFDHIPTGTSTGGGNLPSYSDFPFSYAAVQGASGGVVSDSGGTWLGFSPIGAAGNFWIGYWKLPFSLYDFSKNHTWFGFRFKNTTNNFTEYILSVVNSGGTFQTQLVLGTDYSFGTNVEHYVEVMIDRVNKTRSVWVDGALVVNAVALANGYAILNTDFLAFGSNLGEGASSACGYQYKDMYLMNDPGDGSVSRIGPIISRPITINTASGTGWTPSSGSISGALNTAVNTSTPSTPNVTSASDGTPLAATLATTADAGAAVQGLLFVASGERNSGTGTTLRTTIADQATPPNQSTLNPLQFSTTAFQYGKTLGFAPYAPDGSTWNAAKITALNMSVVASAT